MIIKRLFFKNHYNNIIMNNIPRKSKHEKSVGELWENTEGAAVSGHTRSQIRSDCSAKSSWWTSKGSRLISKTERNL